MESISSSDTECLIFRPRLRKVLALIVGLLTVGLCAMVMTFDLIRGEMRWVWLEPGTWVDPLIAIIMPVICLGGGFFILWRPLSGKPSLVLDEKGWTTGGLTGMTIPWRCVQSVTVLNLQSSSGLTRTKSVFVAVVPRDLEHLLTVYPAKRQKLLRMNLRMFGTVAAVSDKDLPLTADDVIKAVQPFVQKMTAKSQEGLPPVQTVKYPR